MRNPTDFFQVGGTLAPDAPSYLERPADAELLATLEQGELCLVLAPRQTGKSSLMVRTVARLRDKGMHAGIVDLQPLGSQTDPEHWFRDILYQIERSLRLKTDTTEWWAAHTHLGPTQRFMTFLEDIVFMEIHGDVVLFFDEIDSALRLPFSDDFFTTIRSLYNARATNAKFAHLTFVLLGVTTASSFILNHWRTPFNIGKTITLDDFDQAASEPFQRVLGPDSEKLIERIFYWTGGQPWMVQRLAATVYSWPQPERRPERIDEEVSRSYLQHHIEQDTHLKFIQDYLLNEAKPLRKTLTTYRRVLCGEAVVNDDRSTVQSVLKLAGVVRVSDHRLVIRNRIYESVFNLEWVREHIPRKTRELIIWSVLTILVSVLLWMYVVQPLGFPFIYRDMHRDMLNMVKYTPKPTTEITFPTEHTRRAYVNNKEILVPKDGVIREMLSDLKRGHNPAQLRLEGFPWQHYIIPIEVNYYPRWEIRQFQDRSLIPGRHSPHLERKVGEAAPSHNDTVYFVAFSPAGKTVVSGSDDKTLKLWDIDTGHVRHKFTGHEAGIIGVAFSPDGNWVLSGSQDTTLKLWDVNTGKEIQTFTGHTKGIIGVTFSPDSLSVVSGSRDQTVKLWNVKTGEVRRTFRDHSGGVTGVAFSPNGNMIVSGSDDHTLKLWDITTDQAVGTFTGHADGVTGVAFSPDGQLVISGSNDKTLKLWDVVTHQVIRTFEGHKASVIGVAFSPDGRTVVSSSDDQTLKLWNTSTGQPVRTFEGHTESVIGVAFSPDGRTVVSGSSDQTLKLWWAADESQNADGQSLNHPSPRWFDRLRRLAFPWF